MTRTSQVFTTAALAAALATAFGAAIAQDADVKALTKPDSAISVGIGYWTHDRPQQGIYDGMNQGGAYGLLDAYVRRRDDATGTWFNLFARNFGLDTRELRVDWLRQGNIGAFFEYSRTPRDNPLTFYTGVQGIGTNFLRVPAVANPPLGEIHLGTVRDKIGAGFYKNLLPGFDLRINYSNEEKTGTRQWGRGGAPEFAVEPQDTNTQIAEAILSYRGERFQVQGGYIGSWFRSQNGLINTALTTGANPFFLSQPLNNEANQFFANGGYNFLPGTRGTFKVSYTRATQSEHIPTADIPGLALAGAPTNLNGRLDTTLVQLGVTSRINPVVSLLANVRYYNNEEKTPQDRYVKTSAAPCQTGTGPNLAAGVASQCVDNTPLGFETLSGKIEGTFRLPQGFSVVAAVEQANQDRIVPVGVGTVSAAGVDRQRYVPFKGELDETTFRLEGRRSLSDTINGRLSYLYSDRTGSSYTRTQDIPPSDMINPIHIADRERQKWRLVLDWTPLDQLGFMLNVETAKDKYGHDSSRPFGLQDGTADVYSLDATFNISESWSLTAWYAYDITKATQIGYRDASGGAALGVKDARLEDSGNTFGLGLRGRFNPRFQVGADLLYSETESKYPETVLTAGSLYPTGANSALGPLQSITNTLTRFKLFAVYGLDKNSDIRFDYIHERWKTNDWSWQFANGTQFIYGTTTDGTRISQNPNQDSDYFGVRYTYKFQ